MELPEITQILSSTTEGRKVTPNIKAVTIHEFLNSGNRRIRIPDYQRPYSWGKAQQIRLLKDLQDSYKSELRWFMGPIYLTTENGIDEVDLLDGQQRTTSIVILLREVVALKARHQDDEIWQDRVFIDDWADLVAECKHVLFQRSGGGGHQGRFSTDVSVRREFNEWVVGARRIDTQSEYKSNEFEPHENWQLTGKRIKAAIEHFAGWLDEQIADELNCGWPGIKARIEHLLYGFWLIEIPFVTSDEMLKVFEAMNNRGLGLSVGDKFRFKTVSFADKGEERDEVSKAWGMLYQKVELLQTRQLTSGVDDFVQDYLVSRGASLGREKLSDEMSREELMDDLISGSSNSLGVRSVMSELINVADFMAEALVDGGVICRGKLQARQQSGAVSGFEGDKLERLAALFRLSRSLLKTSENFKYLVFHIGRSYGDVGGMHPVALQLWASIRLVFRDLVVFGYSSNKVRTQVLKAVKKLEVAPTNTTFMTVMSEAEADGPAVDSWTSKQRGRVFLQNSNEESFFTLMLYTFLSDKKWLNGLTDEVIVRGLKSHLEHVCPRKWREKWNPNWDDVLGLDGIANTWWGKLVSSDDVLPVQENNNWRDTLTEAIGNKVILKGSLNSAVGNDSWIDKRNAYVEAGITISPSWSNWQGLEEWTPTTIVKNSVLVVELLENQWNSGWYE